LGNAQQTNKKNLSVQQGSDNGGMMKRKIINFTIIPKSDILIVFFASLRVSHLWHYFFFLKSFGHVFSDVLLKGITPFTNRQPTIAIKTSYEGTNENAGSVMKDYR
jgi:hypothetical protein